MIFRVDFVRSVWLCLPVALPLLVSACGSAQTVGGSSTPAATASLAQIQQQIFTPYCAGCHVDGGSGPMSLADPATSYTALVNVDPTNSTARRAGLKRVVPGDPSRSFILKKLTGQMDFGEGDQMPQNAPPLTAAQIALIQQWIQAGAPRGG